MAFAGPVALHAGLALAVFYIVLGCFLDGISMVVLTMGVILPTIQKPAGIDLLWFGIFIVIVVEMAQITPPVGFNLFVLQGMQRPADLRCPRRAWWRRCRSRRAHHAAAALRPVPHAHAHHAIAPHAPAPQDPHSGRHARPAHGQRVPHRLAGAAASCAASDHRPRRERAWPVPVPPVDEAGGVRRLFVPRAAYANWELGARIGELLVQHAPPRRSRWSRRSRAEEPAQPEDPARSC